MTFDEMFYDRRWHDRRQALLDAAGWACVECGCDVVEDDVHICFYPKGRMVWDYPDRAFKVLCPSHRGERRAFERQLRDILPEFTTSDLGVFLDVLDQLKELPAAQRSRAMEELRGAVKRGTEASQWLGT